MKALTLEDQKKLLLEIMDTFHLFCEEHQLTYYLFYGSLLGAVRHQGFIPWDDDIDVIMHYQDYERFLSLWAEAKHPFLKLGHHRSKHFKQYPWSFAKLVDTRTIFKRKDASKRYQPIGVSIDIFPLYPALDQDHACLVSELQELEHRLDLKRYSLKKHLKILVTYVKLKKPIIALKQLGLLMLTLPQSNKSFVKKQEKLLEQTKAINKAMFFFTPSESDATFPKSSFESTSDVIFEGRQYKTVKESNRILAEYYGDYLKPPPTEKQVGHPAKPFLK